MILVSSAYSSSLAEKLSHKNILLRIQNNDDLDTIIDDLLEILNDPEIQSHESINDPNNITGSKIELSKIIEALWKKGKREKGKKPKLTKIYDLYLNKFFKLMLTDDFKIKNFSQSRMIGFRGEFNIEYEKAISLNLIVVNEALEKKQITEQWVSGYYQNWFGSFIQNSSTNDAYIQELKSNGKGLELMNAALAIAEEDSLGFKAGAIKIFNYYFKEDTEVFSPEGSERIKRLKNAFSKQDIAFFHLLSHLSRFDNFNSLYDVSDYLRIVTSELSVTDNKYSFNFLSETLLRPLLEKGISLHREDILTISKKVLLERPSYSFFFENFLKAQLIRELSKLEELNIKSFLEDVSDPKVKTDILKSITKKDFLRGFDFNFLKSTKYQAITRMLEFDGLLDQIKDITKIYDESLVIAQFANSSMKVADVFRKSNLDDSLNYYLMEMSEEMTLFRELISCCRESLERNETFLSAFRFSLEINPILQIYLFSMEKNELRAKILAKMDPKIKQEFFDFWSTKLKYLANASLYSARIADQKGEYIVKIFDAFMDKLILIDSTGKVVAKSVFSETSNFSGQKLKVLYPSGRSEEIVLESEDMTRLINQLKMGNFEYQDFLAKHVLPILNSFTKYQQIQTMKTLSDALLQALPKGSNEYKTGVDFFNNEVFKEKIVLDNHLYSECSILLLNTN
jgi:hypothetical protein